MYLQDDFCPPHDWRRFAVPALVALGLHVVVLVWWQWPIWSAAIRPTLPHLRASLVHAKAKPEVPTHIAQPVQQQSPIQTRRAAETAAPVSKQASHAAPRSKPQPAVTHSEQPTLTRQKFYDSVQQVVEAMSRAKEQRIPMGGETPEAPRQFRHVKVPHNMLLQQWQGTGARLYLRNGRCYTNAGLPSQAYVAAPPVMRKMVGMLTPKKRAIKCPWEKSGERGLHFHQPKYPDPFKKHSSILP